MKSLQVFVCTAFLLAFINANIEETKYLSHVKCAQLFGKCLVKITEKSDVENKEMRLNRWKRSMMNGGNCAQGHIWYLYKCWDCKQYNETKADDYDAITTEPEDENTTPQPGQTPGHRRPVHARTTPHPWPMSGLYKTPHPRTRPSPGPTKRPRKTRPPTSTSQSSSTPSPSTKSLSAPVLVSRAETTYSPHTTTAIILFVLCVFLLNRTV